MNSQLAQLLNALVGKTIWGCGRTADMATFQFGQRIPTLDIYGRPKEVGEYALHVQCAWRIVSNDEVVVGSSDLYYPAVYDEERPFPNDFDYDREPNRRDKRVEEWFLSRSPIVRHFHIATAGACRIELDGDASLEFFPDDSLTGEHWRLFKTGEGGIHVVVSGRSPGGEGINDA